MEPTRLWSDDRADWAVVTSPSYLDHGQHPGSINTSKITGTWTQNKTNEKMQSIGNQTKTNQKKRKENVNKALFLTEESVSREGTLWSFSLLLSVWNEEHVQNVIERQRFVCQTGYNLIEILMAYTFTITLTDRGILNLYNSKKRGKSQIYIWMMENPGPEYPLMSRSWHKNHFLWTVCRKDYSPIQLRHANIAAKAPH